MFIFSLTLAKYHGFLQTETDTLTAVSQRYNRYHGTELEDDRSGRAKNNGVSHAAIYHNQCDVITVLLFMNARHSVGIIQDDNMMLMVAPEFKCMALLFILYNLVMKISFMVTSISVRASRRFSLQNKCVNNTVMVTTNTTGTT